MLILFNEICINEKMLTPYLYIYIYIYVYVCVYGCVCVWVCVCVCVRVQENPLKGGVPVVSWLKRWSAKSQHGSSNSSRAITFTFGQIPLGKVWTPLILQAMGWIAPSLFY